MAFYSSDSHLWSDPHFLKLGRLERILILYLMHGPGRSNVPGIVEDSPVQIADRLHEPVDDIRRALDAMCEDPEVLQVDLERRIIRSALAARMDPHRGAKNIRGWHKNWLHLPEAALKYAHIESLREKVDTTNDEQVRVWNETFGMEQGTDRHSIIGTPPAQLRLIQPSAPPAPDKPRAKQPPRQQEVLKPAAPLPGRDSVEHMDAGWYVEHFSKDLLSSGITREIGATTEMFATAMLALKTKAPGHKRAAEWDLTALNYVDTEVYMAALSGHPTTRGTHEDNRGSRPGPRRAAGARQRSPAPDHSAGQWSEALRQKASEPSVFSDP